VANEQYFPDGVTPPSFYTPSNEGLEQKVAQRLKFLKDLDQKGG
jgi:putative ATPase